MEKVRFRIKSYLNRNILILIVLSNLITALVAYIFIRVSIYSRTKLVHLHFTLRALYHISLPIFLT